MVCWILQETCGPWVLSSVVIATMPSQGGEHNYGKSMNWLGLYRRYAPSAIYHRSIVALGNGWFGSGNPPCENSVQSVPDLLAVSMGIGLIDVLLATTTTHKELFNTNGPKIEAHGNDTHIGAIMGDVKELVIRGSENSSNE